MKSWDALAATKEAKFREKLAELEAPLPGGWSEIDSGGSLSLAMARTVRYSS